MSLHSGVCLYISLSAVSCTYSVFLVYFILREYYHVLFTNLRVMIEAEDTIDQYFGPNGGYE